MHSDTTFCNYTSTWAYELYFYTPQGTIQDMFPEHSGSTPYTGTPGEIEMTNILELTAIRVRT